MTNPFKEGSQNHQLLEAYRANGYRLKASFMHDRDGLCLQSPTRRESDLRKKGFVINIESDGKSKDRWHVLVHDPYSYKQAVESGAKFTERYFDGLEDKPEFGKAHCVKHRRNYPFGSRCPVCITL